MYDSCHLLPAGKKLCNFDNTKALKAYTILYSN